jgi:hypothetical protein
MRTTMRCTAQLLRRVLYCLSASQQNKKTDDRLVIRIHARVHAHTDFTPHNTTAWSLLADPRRPAGRRNSPHPRSSPRVRFRFASYSRLLPTKCRPSAFIARFIIDRPPTPASLRISFYSNFVESDAVFISTSCILDCTNMNHGPSS